MRLRDTMPYCKYLGLALVVTILVLWPRGLAWASPLSNVHRQTMPLTPPPTWTPEQQPGGSEPTAPPSPTRPEPTRPPEDTRVPPTDAPEQPADTPAPPTNTPVAAPDTPTPAPPVAQPWLYLSADPMFVGPSSEVGIRVEIANFGDAVLQTANITLTMPTLLSFVNVRTTSGQIRFEASNLILELNPVQPGGEGLLEIDVVVSADALPDAIIPMRAALNWDGGASVISDFPLVLPWAPLPETGG